MERTTDLETKYQTLAAEYSKVRSQATVLKKAVLDEQAKNLELKEQMKGQDLKLRKHAQEMESLTFRNDQLMKRISVLQQELQGNSHGKRSKSKVVENSVPNIGAISNLSILDEELHKKILENAELVSTMADRELEITNSKEQISWLEDKVTKLEATVENLKAVNKSLESAKLKSMQSKTQNGSERGDCDSIDETGVSASHWKAEAERWKTECELLRSKPESGDLLSEYYEEQIKKIFEDKELAQSETSSLWAENDALSARLEQIVLEKNKLESCLEKSNEELQLINNTYKAQLDAMTEHFAAQNEKITKQCDEIEVLKHKLFGKKQ